MSWSIQWKRLRPWGWLVSAWVKEGCRNMGIISARSWNKTGDLAAWTQSWELMSLLSNSSLNCARCLRPDYRQSSRVRKDLRWGYSFGEWWQTGHLFSYTLCLCLSAHRRPPPAEASGILPFHCARCLPEQHGCAEEFLKAQHPLRAPGLFRKSLLTAALPLQSGNAAVPLAGEPPGDLWAEVRTVLLKNSSECLNVHCRLSGCLLDQRITKSLCLDSTSINCFWFLGLSKPFIQTSHPVQLLVTLQLLLQEKPVHSSSADEVKVLGTAVLLSILLT